MIFVIRGPSLTEAETSALRLRVRLRWTGGVTAKSFTGEMREGGFKVESIYTVRDGNERSALYRTRLVDKAFI